MSRFFTGARFAAAEGLAYLEDALPAKLVDEASGNEVERQHRRARNAPGDGGS